MPNLKFHPAADAFPMMDDRRFAELKADIGSEGLLESIALFDGMILDGRNRYKACLELGIEPKFGQADPTCNPWNYVWSENGERRDLDQETRYLIWKFCHENGEAWQAESQRIADLRVEVCHKRGRCVCVGTAV